MSVQLEPVLRGHKDYNGIQALRFVAAIMVVLTHATFYASERMHVGNVLWSDGAKGVDLFFVISGFVMYVSGSRLAARSDGWRIFVKRRLIRIVPLYWTITTVKLAIMLTTEKLVLHAKLDPIAVLCSYLFIPYYNVDGLIEPILGVGWTLNFEMFFYLIFAVALATRSGIVAKVSAVLALLAAASLLRPTTGPAVLFYLNDIVLEFAFGIWIAALMAKDRRVPPVLASMLVGGGLVLLLAPWLDGLPKIVGHGIPAAMVIYGAASLESRIGQRVPRSLVFLGAASYSLYLVHPLTAPIVPVLLNKIGLQSLAAAVIGSLALAVPASCLVYLYIERPLSALALRLTTRDARQTTRPAEAAE